MIKSMTGYGRATATCELCDIKVEMKSVNSKYMDINVKTPKVISYLEIDIRNIVRDILKRCKLDVFVEIKAKKPMSYPKLNVELLKTYLSMANDMKTVMNTDDSVSINTLFQLKDIIDFENDETFGEQIKGLVMQTVENCVLLLDKMREKEGQKLINDIYKRLNLLSEYRDKISKHSKTVFEKWVEKFKKRIEEMEIQADEDRILQEASIYAEKADITEELVRIKSHISQIFEISKTEYPCGKKMDFMAQELHREFNTIGSKSVTVEVLNNVINAKSEIDKIREQIQNIV
jgi:uncharacterized protein (TIGR00255 family)